MKRCGHSAEECDARRQRAIELNLARFLRETPRPNAWSPESIALLGTMPDDELAEKLGRTQSAVRQKRQELGIPNPSGSHWTSAELARVGTMTDAEVAVRVGRSEVAVYQ